MVRVVQVREGRKIPRYIDCIPTSSVRLVVQDNGGTDTKLSLSVKETVYNTRALERFFFFIVYLFIFFFYRNGRIRLEGKKCRK